MNLAVWLLAIPLPDTLFSPSLSVKRWGCTHGSDKLWGSGFCRFAFSLRLEKSPNIKNRGRASQAGLEEQSQGDAVLAMRTAPEADKLNWSRCGVDRVELLCWQRPLAVAGSSFVLSHDRSGSGGQSYPNHVFSWGGAGSYGYNHMLSTKTRTHICEPPFLTSDIPLKSFNNSPFVEYFLAMYISSVLLGAERRLILRHCI